MKIYTKTGDKCKTSLFGGDRVWKDDLRLNAYGTVDELNAVIGTAVTEIKNVELKNVLMDLQNELFVVGSDLATPVDKANKKVVIPRIGETEISKIEEKIDYFNNEIPELKQFILPGGTKGASFLHLARTVCRRAEREVVTLAREVEIGNHITIYLNRLSDLLFVLSRFENFSNNTPDVEWKK
ncbi:cob(I)yrinic acid a,c-diamide adenosyltransferase [Bacteroidota bacterium]